MDKIDIIYDHYKDTYSIQKENEKSRNKLFIILCFCILLLVLMTISPNNIYENIQQFFFKKIGINIKFELSVLEIFNWFIILYLTIRYFQINANIEKNYKYIHEIEDKIGKEYKIPIYREGRNYLNQYPIFLQFSYLFYKYVFPVLFIILIFVKIICNIINKINVICLLVSISIGVCIFILNVSYFIFNYQLWQEGNKDG